MPRLFTGIALPADIRMRLSMVRGQLPGARWVAAENMHLTLRFAGDMDGRTADEFARLLDDVRGTSFNLTLAGLDMFGGRDPHTLWVGATPEEPLDALRRAHDRAARACGLGPVGQPFKPHVTLARLRGLKTTTAARFLGDFGGFRTEPFLVDRFVLFSARPTTGGPPYAIEHEYFLDEPAAGQALPAS
ncbi:MAG: RNA 2',3'-cyclic phosphodiesterase [Hyphomicrobiaceae bacterium]